MAKKSINWKTKGMNRDASVSIFSSEFAFENRNVRLSTNESNTMMSWVNEKGTKKAVLKIDTTPWAADGEEHTYTDAIEGIPVGTAIINHQLVIFTSEDSITGNIYVFKKSESEDCDYEGKLLAHNNYKFDVEHPLETLVVYESSDVQKVYWTDYKNQLRFINIAATPKNGYGFYTQNSFDFKLPVGGMEYSSRTASPVKITKIHGSGEFPAGVIQYAFTYYNKYGQETNIFYVSPLQYISYLDRGGSPEDKIAVSFKLEINPSPYEHEYLRIYSILRTSINATPFVKRVIDMKINGTEPIVYTDTGTNGDTVDPTELLYKSGSAITARTMEQKDNTLFLGGVKTLTNTMPKALRTLIKSKEVAIDTTSSDDIEDKILINTKKVTFKGTLVNSGDFKYVNSIGISGYKYQEWYRIGIQFQDTLGDWSEPMWIKDYQIKERPSIDFDKGELYIPQVEVSLPKDVGLALWNNKYVYSRLLMAEPSANDRTIICQGIANPTLYQNSKRYKLKEDGTTIDTNAKGSLYGQPSWIFRPRRRDLTQRNTTASDGGGYIPSKDFLTTLSDGMRYSKIPNPSTGILSDNDPACYIVSPGLNSIEIGCTLSSDNSFKIDQDLITIHSPELVFDETLYSKDWEGFKMRNVGEAIFTNTFGDIDIQTATPTIGSAGGFKGRSIKTEGDAALVSGLYYEDFIVEEYNGDKSEGVLYRKYKLMQKPVVWPVYLWHHDGSLNNDCTRANRSAELLKKKISNYHLATKFKYYDNIDTYTGDIKFFHSDEIALEKVNDNPYMGNIDTMVLPDYTTPDFKYFSRWPFEGTTGFFEAIKGLALQTERCCGRLANRTTEGADSTDADKGLYVITLVNGEKYDWNHLQTNIGDIVSDLNETSEGVRIKYKSTPHLVLQFEYKDSGATIFNNTEEAALPIVEIYKDVDLDTLYGGTSTDALKANNWIPISEPSLLETTDRTITTSGWGDTYYQTFECLKTYAFSQEDVNQVVDIASFICETHVNIDGRYDRNRMQTNNLNMTPQNFNLLNPVYSQMNNFFTYKIQDADDYERVNNSKEYQNIVTWSLTKQNGADVDAWTNITLASTLELDGDKGNINKLVKLDNQLFAFQDKGIAQILYNEQTQITSTEGVPIEIANSGKVQGKRYYSNTVGCSNKYSIVATPTGVYFMDSNNKSIYLFNGQLNNLSTSAGFNTWAKQNIPSSTTVWTPFAFKNFISYYDQLNQEILFINDKEALAYSEKFNCFTSFYDYGTIPYFCNLDDEELWIAKDGGIWKHQAGEYCNFFDENKGFSITLIGNQEPQVDKIFTNLEFRACVDGEGTFIPEGKDDDGNILTKESFTPTLPFDSLEVWNEYQHGILNLTNRNKGDRFIHGTKDGNTWLNRKFRIWRCDMPRDNAPVNENVEKPMGIKRFKARPLDRIRNPWVYIQLRKKAASEGSFLSKTEIHDIVASYFG